MRLLIFVFLLAGCAQSAGDRCQRRSDCADGLACVLPDRVECPTAFPNCPPCLVGGVCEPITPTEQRCQSTSDCAAGLSCLVSRRCTEAGELVCTAVADLGGAD